MFLPFPAVDRFKPIKAVRLRRAGIARRPLQFAGLTPVDPLHKHVARRWQQAAGEALAVRALPARRSVFVRRGAPLLVMEVFSAPHAPWCWPTPRRALNLSNVLF